MLPILGEMENFATKGEIKRWIELETIQMMPIALLRGQNFNYCYVAIDEGQNLTFDQLFLILTRFGEKSKMVVSGDFNQSDLPPKSQGGFQSFFEILEGMNGVGMCHLTKDDIVRSKFVRELVDRVETYKKEIERPVKYYGK